MQLYLYMPEVISFNINYVAACNVTLHMATKLHMAKTSLRKPYYEKRPTDHNYPGDNIPNS